MLKNVLLLASGTGFAQLIPIVATPVLAKIYTPDMFGEFALFSTFLAVLSVFSSGKYELAIALPKKTKESESLFSLGLWIALTFSAILVIFVPVIQFGLTKYYGKENLDWVWLLPFSVLFFSIVNLSSYMLNRLNDFNIIAKLRVLQAALIAGTSIIIGLYGNSHGLILASVITGFLVSIVYVNRLKGHIHSSVKKFKELGSRYDKFPKFLIVGSLFNTVSSQLPVLMFSAMYGASIVGTIFLAQRVISLPSALISKAVGDAARQSLSEKIVYKSDAYSYFKYCTKNLFLIGLIPFSLAFFVGPILIEEFLSKEWSGIGTVIQILIPMYFVQFSVSSLSSVVIQLTERLKIDLVWQVSLFVTSASAMFLANKVYDSAYVTLLAYATVYSLHYFIAYLLACWFLKNVDENCSIHN
ncbi:oligosaccharide flippase family protein [Enterovibrio norvegicus]|uniref:Membrane protein involved in the export of O-antigen and teichoic acid n=1 Tax=Enterovibrio norvegicus DSM 15893 TaxID=1121869 RepID=A0A1I5N8R4_9GAMM|nr:oligosaccharide flippase family protein [Enterovibrio norvegicus]SFP18113.1 Membrane protein involved in the export of O-antigen and teichoic acid [Enterovibrio norvegicus DSM 15893]